MNAIFPYSALYNSLFLAPDGHWAMDVRHALILYNLVRLRRFRTMIEVGCHHGMSTTALVHALSEGFVERLHLCDIAFTLHVRQMAYRWTPSGQIVLHERGSLDTLPQLSEVDAALLDGDHTSPVMLGEFEMLSRLGVRHLVLHDTRTWERADGREQLLFDGPPFIAERLATSGNWHWLEDCRSRPGERTDRGLFFATRDPGTYEAAESVFAYWTSVPAERLFPPELYDENGVPRGLAKAS